MTKSQYQLKIQMLQNALDCERDRADRLERALSVPDADKAKALEFLLSFWMDCNAGHEYDYSDAKKLLQKYGLTK